MRRRILYALGLAGLLLAPAGGWAQRLTTFNVGAEFATVATRPITQTCGEDPGCITLAEDTWLDGATVQWTNYLPDHVALFVLIASADGTPWAPGALRLHSAVVRTTASPYTIPGPYFLPAGWQVFTAIDVFREAWDLRVPHVEHQTTLRVRSAADDGL